MDSDTLHTKLFNEYGNIVRLYGLMKEDIIILYNPEDAEMVFRHESSMPIRKAFFAIEEYRKKTRKDIFGSGQDLLTSQGEEWYNFRRIVNQPMVQPRSAKLYVEPVQGVARVFIDRMKRIRDDNLEMPENFFHEMNKWALESISTIALDTTFGCLEDNLKPDSDAVKMISSVNAMFDILFVLEMAWSWKVTWSPKWKQLTEVLDTISEIALKHINRKWEMIKARDPNQASGNPSVLENILLRADDRQVAFTMAMDMLTAGVDTTSTALANLLYQLSKNPDKQEKLYEELKTLMPDKNHNLTANDLENAKYLKACLKECLRISPVVIGTQRETTKDLVLSNYRVPKGVKVITNYQIMCQQETYFKDPLKYIPERWLKSETDSEYSVKKVNPFVYLPFGFGPRSCIGRRFAELEIFIMASEIIRNFKISYNYGDMAWKSQILNIPEKPLRFKMEDRMD